jgi:hypothetical protein
MSNTYRALSDSAKAAFAEGVFEHEFTPTEESDWVNSGLIEIVPRKYKVLSNNYAAGKQGATVEAALLVELEAALISGGHIERVDSKPDTTTKRKS